MDSIVPPLKLNVVRLLALGTAAIAGVAVVAAVYFPYTVLKMGNIFDGYTYLNSFFLLMLPSVLLSILAASLFYQLFCRVAPGMILYLAFMLLSFNKLFADNNILYWINPSMPELSDYFTNTMVFRLMQHNRMFWFLSLGGLWLFGLLCVRSHGKGFWGSVLHNSRKVYIPLLAVALIGSAFYVYKNQPYVYENSETGYPDTVNEQLNLLTTNFEISFDTARGSLSGKASYSLLNLSGKEQKCRFKVKPGYSIRRITANGKEIASHRFDNERRIEFSVPDTLEISLFIEYDGMPAIEKASSDNLIVLGASISNKYIDLMNNEMIPTLQVAQIPKNYRITGKFTLPAGLAPVVIVWSPETGQLSQKGSNGAFKLLSEDGNRKTWVTDMNSDSFSFMAGDYVLKKLGPKDMPIEFYYSRKLEANMQKKSAEKMVEEAVNFCASHYGKLHNVSENNPLKVIQKTIFFPGGIGLQNFSTMPETEFSDQSLEDEVTGAYHTELLTHEIIHQWWGIQSIGEDGIHKNWSAEGLTVYTTYRVMKEKYGEAYAQKNYVDQWKKDVKFQADSFYSRHPEYLDILPPKYSAAMSGWDRDTCHYSIMPLQILKAAGLVGGEARMDEILAKLYQNSQKVQITLPVFLDACGLKEEDLNIE